MHIPLFSFGRIAPGIALATVVLLLAGCPPTQDREIIIDHGPDTYVASNYKLFDRNAEFDIRWRVVYAESHEFDPTTAVTDRELTLERCTHCHDCGFPVAFSLADYETMNWNPQIKGEDWAMPIRRMMVKENAFLNDAIASRIFSFLRDETLGLYDESADPAGGIIIEVDELPEIPEDVEPEEPIILDW